MKTEQPNLFWLLADPFLPDKVLTFQLPAIFHIYSKGAILRRQKNMEEKRNVCICVHVYVEGDVTDVVLKFLTI